MRRTAALVAFWSVTAAAALPVPERVTFASLDRSVAGAPVEISALLYRPEGAAPGYGFPAIVALHGCGGMYSTARGREGTLSLHNLAWAEQLVDAGYAVLFPDSFNPRGRRQVCTVKPTERGIDAATRRLDALGALAWLAARGDVDRDRVALIGFSHGGSTTLAAINARDPAVAAFRGAPGAPPYFRAAVAYYPGCRATLRAGERWQPAIPTRIHIGAADDWTPAVPCVALGAAMQARGEDLAVAVYPDSYHGFDTPGDRRIVRKDIATGVDPAAGVTLAGNPEAAAAAWRRTRAFLQRSLAPRPDYLARAD